MELKEFIKVTIAAITEGIAESQIELKEKGIIVSPEKMGTGAHGDKVLRTDGWRYVQDLDFEILVQVEERTTSEGSAKIKVYGIGQIGGDLGTQNASQAVNKLKFKIPVSLPTTPTPEQYTSNKGHISVHT